MKKEGVVLEDAAVDIERGMDFYHSIEEGLDLYFSRSVFGDIQNLGNYFGTHRTHFGYFRSLCSRFPYAIYYRDRGSIRQIVAVLDLRQDPRMIRNQLATR